MQAWQLEAWITWMQTNPNAWRITSSKLKCKYFSNYDFLQFHVLNNDDFKK